MAQRDTETWSNLRRNVNLVGSTMLQKQLQEQQRKQTLQDAVRKALITAKLEGRIGKGLDINSLISGGALPDLSQLEITPDLDTLSKSLRTKFLAQRLGQQRRLNVMGGIEPPSEEEMAEFGAVLPEFGRFGMGMAEGGMVTTPLGATLREGEILAPEGERIGEYLPGYEPQEIPIEPERVAEVMRGRFAPGITKEELAREALGMPKFTGKAAQGITPAQALNILSDPIKAQSFKRRYPDLYPLLEEIATQTLTGKTRFTGKPTIDNETDVADINW